MGLSRWVVCELWTWWNWCGNRNDLWLERWVHGRCRIMVGIRLIRVWLIRIRLIRVRLVWLLTTIVLLLGAWESTMSLPWSLNFVGVTTRF